MDDRGPSLHLELRLQFAHQFDVLRPGDHDAGLPPVGCLRLVPPYVDDVLHGRRQSRLHRAVGLQSIALPATTTAILPAAADDVPATAAASSQPTAVIQVALRAPDDTEGGERQELPRAGLELVPRDGEPGPPGARRTGRPDDGALLRGHARQLVPARSNVLQTEPASRGQHLHVQAREVSPVPRPVAPSLRAHLQHVEVPRARDGARPQPTADERGRLDSGPPTESRLDGDDDKDDDDAAHALAHAPVATADAAASARAGPTHAFPHELERAR